MPLMLALVGVLTITAPAQQALPKGMVELKGHELPEHAVWRSVFYHLTTVRQQKWDDVLGELSPEDREVVLKEAAKQDERG